MSSQKTEKVSKAGRHRLYSNEQRKDRNRKAQAAFRVRRNKYTETLELEAAMNEQTVQELKDANEKSLQRAETAERRCAQLDAQVASLQTLLQQALEENKRIVQDESNSSTNVSIASSLDQPQDTFAVNWLDEMSRDITDCNFFPYIFTDLCQNDFILDIL